MLAERAGTIRGASSKSDMRLQTQPFSQEGGEMDIKKFNQGLQVETTLFPESNSQTNSRNNSPFRGRRRSQEKTPRFFDAELANHIGLEKVTEEKLRRTRDQRRSNKNLILPEHIDDLADPKNDN
jgi:hypothetical protein